MANVEKLERKGGVNGAESIEVYTRRKAKDVEYGVKTVGSYQTPIWFSPEAKGKKVEGRMG